MSEDFLYELIVAIMLLSLYFAPRIGDPHIHSFQVPVCSCLHLWRLHLVRLGLQTCGTIPSSPTCWRLYEKVYRYVQLDITPLSVEWKTAVTGLVDNGWPRIPLYSHWITLFSACISLNAVRVNGTTECLQ